MACPFFHNIGDGEAVNPTETGNGLFLTFLERLNFESDVLGEFLQLVHVLAHTCPGRFVSFDEKFLEILLERLYQIEQFLVFVHKGLHSMTVCVEESYNVSKIYDSAHTCKTKECLSPVFFCTLRCAECKQIAGCLAIPIANPHVHRARETRCGMEVSGGSSKVNT